jgi:Protein of unknown function (DUF664)
MTQRTERTDLTPLTGEHADLLASLAHSRRFLRYTVRDLTDDEATRHTTVSQLCLGGLIKHVTMVEGGWAGFILEGPSALLPADQAGFEAHARSFCMLEDETLAELLDEYERVARGTDELVASLPSLDVTHPLPEAPWFDPGARWSARRAVLHIVAETAQHAGHADIIRESLDGAKSMG